MKYWYDVLTDVNGNESLVLFPDGETPAPKDFDNVYPVAWGVNGYIYFNTKQGAVMVNSHLSTLVGCKVYVTIK